MRFNFKRRMLMLAGIGSWLGAFQAGAAEAVAAPAPAILILGDSLSAEYGLKRGSGWVALLTQRLQRERIAARVVNASISGETTSGGRSRLPALLQKHQPSHVIIELGGNDALRGLPLNMTEDNLRVMAQTAKAAGARVLVAGMQGVLRECLDAGAVGQAGEVPTPYRASWRVAPRRPTMSMLTMAAGLTGSAASFLARSFEPHRPCSSPEKATTITLRWSLARLKR